MPERKLRFVTRILNDFAFQSRSLLWSPCDDNTFRRLARGIIRIAGLDFDVATVESGKHGMAARLAGVHTLPEWEPFDNQVVSLGRAWLVLSQHPKRAVPLVHQHFRGLQQVEGAKYGPRGESADTLYLILSISHIVLCRFHNGVFEYAQPQSLFSGVDNPSLAAIELLLIATSPTFSPRTIHSLPVELQDQVLGHLSLPPIQKATVACLLDIGSPLSWESKSRRAERDDGDRWWFHRGIKEEIWFDRDFSRVSYRAALTSTPGPTEELRSSSGDMMLVAL